MFCSNETVECSTEGVHGEYQYCFEIDSFMTTCRIYIDFIEPFAIKISKYSISIKQRLYIYILFKMFKKLYNLTNVNKLGATGILMKEI